MDKVAYLNSQIACAMKWDINLIKPAKNKKGKNEKK